MGATGPREFTINGVRIDLDQIQGTNPELVELFGDLLRQMDEQRVDTERALTDTDDTKTDNMRVWMGA